jgi:hypothetical protein
MRVLIRRHAELLKVAESEGKEGVWTYKLWKNSSHGWKSPDTARRDLLALENMGFLEKKNKNYQLVSGFHVSASKGISVSPGHASYVITPVAFVANSGSYVYRLLPDFREKPSSAKK